MARVHVIIDEELLLAIDRRVGQRGRSRFLDQAAREWMKRLDLEEALGAGAGMLGLSGYPAWQDADRIVDWVRQIRAAHE